MTFATFHQHHSTSFHVQRPARFAVALLASTALTVPPALAGDALPTGGQVVSGAVSIGTSGTATTIVQSSDKAIVNWTGFSVGAGNAVNIVQPGASSALLNRVTGATTSTIAGSITANGQVYLINPNGIAITSSGSVKVGGGFVASTLDMSNEDFLAGRNTFKGNGASAGVSNAGIITVGRGGYAALIGGTVKNDGLIAVPVGKVGLGSGEQATLDLSGDGFLQVAVPTEAGAEGKGALIESAGSISAEGGTVVMRAATARNAARNAINLSDVVEARSVSGRDGEITLGGGEGGKVALSGKVRATSASGKGGKITVTAKNIALKGATVDASGATGGGTVKIGGDRQGSGTTPHAETVSIDAQSAIHADATETGKGGSVVVWSDGHTGFAGLITARGAGAGSIAGANAGTGGEVEVSGKALLDYTGFTDLSGPGGFGTLLLDPYNVTISSGAASNASGTSATGNDSVINAATLVTALSAANVTITTGASGSAGSQAGNITVADAVTWTSGSALTLSAYGSITLNANLSGGTGATVVLRADNSATGTGTVSFGSGATVTASGGVSIFYNPASYASPTSYSGNMGSGTSVTAFMLVNTLANLQAINTNLSDTYALGTDIDASATATWNGGAGFSPIGNDTNKFTGMFDGQGHTINGLTISFPYQNVYVGLFGYSTGIVRNVGLVGGSVTGGVFVGGLIGYNYGGSIINAYATGSVLGAGVVGGLIGYSFNGSISNAYATGSVKGIYYVGGLVGADDYSSVNNVYATGSVTGTSDGIGGLIGKNRGTISNAYATGSVAGGADVGGLVGYNDTGTITASFFDTETTGQSNGVGRGSASGVTGLTTAQARDAGNYTGWDFSSEWYQSGDMRPILRSEAAVADAQGVITIANLHQMALIGANLSGNYVLSANLDASATSGSHASDIWSSAGWVPVGNDSNRFAGTFDGQGHTINDLTINRPSSIYVGLFGYNRGTVRNIGLVGGSVAGGAFVGGLIGIQEGGAISNAYATGSVRGSSDYVGGLIGFQEGGAISRAYATGSVWGSSNYVGGLIGFQVNGAISRAYATGSVSGSSDYVGGLVGYSNGSINNAYATGKVTGVALVGGLVGYSDNSISNVYATGSVAGVIVVGGLVGGNYSGTISNAYATGSVTGDQNVGGLFGYIFNSSMSNTYATGSVTGYENVGGLVGDNVNGSITASFFDTQTTGQSNGVGFASGSGVTGLTTAQARDSISYTGWDFSSVWYQTGDMRPILRSEAAVADAQGIVTIANLHQLALIGTNLSGSYVLSANLDASATSGSNASDIWSTAGWVPLGDGSNGFTATFDGQGHTISGLTINRSSSYFVGLFGSSSGTIRNVGLVGGSVTGDIYVGGLVGYTNYGSTISNSYITGDVTGSFFVGGLVGANNNGGTVRNSYATGSVAGAVAYIGGLVGYNGGTISNAYATGRVAVGADVGGLVGWNYGNTGTITASFFDINTTGQSNGVGYGSASGVTGLTTAQMSSLSSFTGASWDIDDEGGTGAVWRIYDGYTTPLLRSFMSALTITGGAGSKTYDGTATSTSVGQLTYSNSGYDAALLSGTATYTSSSANVGSYSNATLSGLYSGPSGYDITFVGGTLSVTKAALTVTAKDAAKTYDGLSYSGGNGVDYTGFVTGETVAVLGGSLAIGGTSQGAVNAGSYTLTASGLTSDNYTIGYGDGTLSVNKAALTVTAKDAAKTYDGLSYSGGNGVDYTGFVTGETVAVLGGSLTYGGTSQTAVNAGSYTLTASGLTSDNYIIGYGDGTLSVNKAALTVTAKDAAKTYDGLSYSGGNGVDYIGLVHSETASVLGGSLAYGGTSQTAVNAGSYTLTASGLTSSNYTIAYGDGTLAVNKAALTVTAKDAAKTYDGLTYSGGNGVDYIGLVHSETASVLGGSLAYGGTSQTAVNAGSYTLTASGLTSSNYTIAYGDGTLAVNKAALTVTATNAAKTYDGLSYSGGNGVTYSGFVNGQTETVLGGSIGYGGTSQGAENAGSYTLAASGLTSGNYAITYADGALTVNKAALTVTANNQTRLFNLQNPALTWAISAGALFQGDTLTGALSTGATTASPVGDYAISRGSLAASQNYDLAFLDGVLSVTPVPSTALSGQFTNGIGLGSNTSASGPAAQIVVIGSAATSPDLATNSLGCAVDPDPTVACAAN
jgi:filamentous hemagglutinin family protein